MKKIFTKEFIIGICVIVAGIILFLGIDYLKGINLFTPANFYYAEYDNVTGLETASIVSVDGYKVGQVREIQFDYDKPGKIKVLLALNKNLHLPADTKAYIESTMLSGSYINLKLGKSKEMIPVGGNVETGVVSDLMSSLSNDVMPTINAILPKIDSLLCNLNALVADPALASSINRIDGITANILAASSGLNTTMNQQIPSLMRGANGVVTDIDSITGNLMVLSAQLKQLPLCETMDNVKAVTANLEQFSNSLNNPNSTLGMLTKDPELYNRANRVAADIDSLIVDIKKNPKRYISIKLL